MTNTQPPPPPVLPPPPPSERPIPQSTPTFEGASATPGLALSEEQRLVVGVVAAIGLLLCVAAMVMGSDWLPGVFGMFLLVYSAIIVAGSLPAHWISQRVDRVLDRWVRDKTGSGYYGMVALAVFSHAEVADIIGGVFSGWEFVKGSVVEHFIGFSADSITHFVNAIIWPFRFVGEYGLLQTGAFAGGCWAVFQVGRSFLPMPDLVKVKSPEESPKKRKRDVLRKLRFWQ